MADWLTFQWLCIRQAWIGCWIKANELGAVFGGALLFFVLYAVRHQLEELKLIEAPSSYWGVAGYTVVLAAASVLLVFLVIFVGRLIVAPARLYWEQRKILNDLEERLRPKIDVYFTPEELGTECVHHPYPNTTFVRIVVVNTSESVPLEGCEAHLESIYFRRSENEDFLWLPHFSPINLSWSGLLYTTANEKYGAIKLMPRERRPVDVIRSFKNENGIFLAPENPAFREHWLSDHGTYRLRVVIFGEPSKPKEIFLDVKWAGNPANLIAEQGPAVFDGRNRR